MDFTAINPRDQRWWQHRYAERVGFLCVPHAALDANPALDAEITKASNRGGEVFAFQEHTVLPIFQSKITQSHLGLAMSAGGDVYDLPMFIEVDSVNDLVPAGFFGTVVDGENLTWSEWMGETFAAIDRDGRTFISSQSNTNTTPLLSELLPNELNLVLPHELPQSTQAE